MLATGASYAMVLGARDHVDVAEFLRGYIEAGCSVINVIPCASDHETGVAAVAEVRQLLRVCREIIYRASACRGFGWSV